MHSSEDISENSFKDPSEDFSEDSSKDSSEDSRACPQHPLLGNFHLPVEIEGASRQSGIQTLSRMGWDEDSMFPYLQQLNVNVDYIGCRSFLVMKYGWVPRNFSYEDGLKLIHPMLAEASGMRT
jgi:hypothetical protein